VGVKPDVAVDITDYDLLRGIDAQLETGIRSLTSTPGRTSLSPFPSPRAMVPSRIRGPRGIAA